MVSNIFVTCKTVPIQRYLFSQVDWNHQVVPVYKYPTMLVNTETTILRYLCYGGFCSLQTNTDEHDWSHHTKGEKLLWIWQQSNLLSQEPQSYEICGESAVLWFLFVLKNGPGILLYIFMYRVGVAVLLAYVFWCVYLSCWHWHLAIHIDDVKS